MSTGNFPFIATHYEQCWGSKGKAEHWKLGPSWQMTPGFQVLVYSPTARRNAWTYATSGMSQQGDAPAIELHLFSPVQTEAHVELLTIVAHFHLTGSDLGLGHTVNFGRPWLAGSKCDHGLISLPYLDGPQLEWLKAEREIRFLWLVPVTPQEVEFAKANGLEALESCLEAAQFNYLDPKRPGVV